MKCLSTFLGQREGGGAQIRVRGGGKVIIFLQLFKTIPE